MKSVSIMGMFMIIAAAMLTASCRGDGGDDSGSNGGGGGDDCQSCIDDYCDCIDGVSDFTATQECAKTTQECAASKCTGAEAADLDYNSCGTGGSGDGSRDSDTEKAGSVKSSGACQDCIDDYCTCINGTSDMDVLYACTVKAASCTEAACTDADADAVNLDQCE